MYDDHPGWRPEVELSELHFLNRPVIISVKPTFGQQERQKGWRASRLRLIYRQARMLIVQLPSKVGY